MRLTGATLVLPDRVLSPGTLSIEGDRIAEARIGAATGARDLSRHIVVPGFIDVHVHGVERVDSLDGGGAIEAIAGRLTRYGVTAFCPTSVACTPEALRDMLGAIRAARSAPRRGSARVLPAHLESNFINPDFRGAQPLTCICAPRARAEGGFGGEAILLEIAASRPEVGIITLAPEVDGVLELIPQLAGHGHRVSLGHSGATYDIARAGIAAGARHATHLFNRMSPFGHRDPGLTGAILDSGEVAAELICDGVHVHPAAIRAAVAAKGIGRIIAITDGTGASGLAPGETASLGGRPITVAEVARLADGTIAGSILTMDRVFANLVGMGFSLHEAAQMCATTPARELGLEGHGALVPGAIADFVVLDERLRVTETYIAGELVFRA